MYILNSLNIKDVEFTLLVELNTIQAEYKFVFTYNRRQDGTLNKAIDTGTVVESKVYYVIALITSDQYSNSFRLYKIW